MQLKERRQRILQRIVEEYVTTAQPVGSELIARKYEQDLSSATIRNEMAALEDEGFIAQPHKSAGRVPTDLGYRVIVEQLLLDGGQALPSSEQHAIRSQFQQVAGDPGESAHLASTVLARGVHTAAVATRPTAPRARILRIELIAMQDDVVLVTVILQSGLVRQVLQHVDDPLAELEVARITSLLNEHMTRRTLAQVARSVASLAGDEALFAGVALRLLQQAEDQAFADVYYEGLTQLLSQPEFAQSERLRPIVEVLEHQTLLKSFLAQCLSTPGVQVVIGAENQLEQMRDASVVLTRYGTSDEACGVLGVVGPTRLPYWRAVPMVRFMAGLMSALVEGQPTGPLPQIPLETPKSLTRDV